MTPSPTDTARYLEADKPTKLSATMLMLMAFSGSVKLPEYGGEKAREERVEKKRQQHE